MNAPKAKKINKELKIHNHTRIDPYYWLREKENPEVIQYLKDENTYTDSCLKHTENFQNKLYDEIIGRIKQTDMSVPYKLNGYYYYSRYEESKEHPIYCRKKETLEATEEIMLNVNDLAKEHDYYHVNGLSISPNNQILAYGVDTLSRRIYTIHFKNLDSGEELPGKIENTTGGATWANDNKTIFYTQKDEALRPHKIHKHVLGSTGKDVEIYHEKDETYSTFVFKTKSREYIMIGSHSTLSSEYRYINADHPENDFKIILKREKDHEYGVAHYGDLFYITTNDGAKNFRLVSTPVNDTEKKHWKEIIPHRKDVLIEDIELFKDYLVIEERKNGLTQLRVINWSDKSEYYIPFNEEVYMAYISTNPDFDSEILRYGYSSLTTPNSVFDFNLKTREQKLLKQQEVIGNFSSTDYHAERLYATANDGTQVPISLVYKKDLKKDTNPLLLYGYGSYGHSIDPYFSSIRLSLLDRGFIFAIAHVRGGEEMGRKWYDDGKLLKKKNTFTDFISCAEYLISKGYTTPEKLLAMGGSAGGLLIGSVINLKPELFKGAIASVPFVDVTTTMLDESIPLTTGEYDEWGNPNNKEYYDYILSYSPYDNVESKAYPNLLVTTGLHDSQVQYWEPAKWVAKLRDLKTDNNSLLLFTNMSTGHGGASGRFERHKETALEYAFLLDLVGISS